jgi:hypothetical protein
MKGGWSGKPLDVLVIDDPYKDRERADSQAPQGRGGVVPNVAIPRFPTAGLIVLVQTRWHPDDLAGYVIRSEAAHPEEQRRWRFVNVPAQAMRPPSPTTGTRSPGGSPTPSAAPPARYLLSARGRTPEDWAPAAPEVGEMVWGSLYQQHPTPPEGAIFAYEHIERNRRPPGGSPPAPGPPSPSTPPPGAPTRPGSSAATGAPTAGCTSPTTAPAAMTEAAWARVAWLLVLDTQADDLVWEQNLAGPTMRRALEAAWQRIVQQVRTLEAAEAELTDPFTGRPPPALGEAIDPDRRLLEYAALRWAATEQRLPEREEARPSAEDLAQLEEVLLRDPRRAVRRHPRLPPRPPHPRHRDHRQADPRHPVATAYETNRVSHVGTLPELEAGADPVAGGHAVPRPPRRRRVAGHPPVRGAPGARNHQRRHYAAGCHPPLNPRRLRPPPRSPWRVLPPSPRTGEPDGPGDPRPGGGG